MEYATLWTYINCQARISMIQDKYTRILVLGMINQSRNVPIMQEIIFINIHDMRCGYQQHKKNNYKNNGQKKYRKWIVLDYYMNKYEDASGITVQILGFKQA